MAVASGDVLGSGVRVGVAVASGGVLGSGVLVGVAVASGALQRSPIESATGMLISPPVYAWILTRAV